MKKISGRQFAGVFGIPMTEIAEELHVTREYVSQVFRGKVKRNGFTDQIADILTELADKNLKADMETAKYRRELAERYIEFVKNLDEKKGW